MDALNPKSSTKRENSEREITKRVAQRWTEKLAAGGWTPICHAFLDLYRKLPSPLSPTEAMVIVMLMKFKWDDRMPYPALKRLGRMMGLGLTSMRNYIRGLEKKGYLQRVHRIGMSNAFDLTPLFEKLEKTLDQVEKEKSKNQPEAIVSM